MNSSELAGCGAPGVSGQLAIRATAAAVVASKCPIERLSTLPVERRFRQLVASLFIKRLTSHISVAPKRVVTAGRLCHRASPVEPANRAASSIVNPIRISWRTGI
jgi:hypothetical protein